MNKINYIIAAVLAVILITVFAVVAFTDEPGNDNSDIEEATNEKSENEDSSTDDESPDNSSVSKDGSEDNHSSGDGSEPDESSEVSDPSEETTSEPDTSETEPVIETWEYDGLSVRHLFTHCLIAWPELAPSGAYRDCVTVSEWNSILQQLYDNDFVLIDINYMYETYTDTDGTQKIRIKDKITVPKGKKPVVISIDDVVYDPKKTNQGMVDKLVVKNGELWAYTLFKDGTEDYSQDNEIFPILESFIKEHPDFSYKNARCTLCLTGFCGILGYRTAPSFADQGIDYMAERNKAAVVVDWLKKHGYSFASHSYAHGMMGSFSAERMEEDCKQWKDEVASLVGETCIFVYPYGDWPKYDTRQHKILLEYGFKFFCGTSIYNYLANGFPGKGASVGNAFCDRFTMAGTILEKAAEKNDSGVYDKYKRMSEYFDPFEVYDNENRPVKLVRPDDL
ncbi:MAG: polysaccharide deacetylase family protein [Eubacteriales bacterium]|nr:polysaccharide deacetylase family protein [Eubacteriales bacterium]